MDEWDTEPEFGGVAIPEALWPYMRGMKRIKSSPAVRNFHAAPY